MKLERAKKSDSFFQNKILILFSVGFLIMLFLDIRYLCANISSQMFSFKDFKGQWQICALALRGVDPYLQIDVANPAVPEIGSIPVGWGTSPWGMLLGNIVYPGFLNEATAFKWFIAASVIVLAATFAVVFIKLKKNSLSYAIMAIPVLLLPNYVLTSVLHGNAGFVFCAFTVLACLICDDLPIVSGVLLGFAMIKPQVAALVCLTLLLLKKFKVLIAAAAVDVAATLAACVMLKKAPWVLASEFLGADIGGDNSPYRGFMNILYVYFDLDENITMALSMIFGIIFTVIFVLLLKNKTEKESAAIPFYIFFIPCIITTMWSYSWLNDYYIMVPAGLVFLYELIYAAKTGTKIFSGFLLILTSFSSVIMTIISKFIVLLIRLNPVFGFLNANYINLIRFYYESILLLFLLIYIFSKFKEARINGKSEKLS